MNEIGKNVRRLRKGRGMTQQDLSYKAGVSHTTLWLVEKGQTTPRLSIAEKLADALDVSAEEILFPKTPTLKVQADVDESKYEDFIKFIGTFNLEGLNRLAKDLRDEQKRALVAKDYAMTRDLYDRSYLISKRIEELDPPLATVTVNTEGRDTVVFHREPTEEEREKLEEQYPGVLEAGRALAT